MYVFQKLVWIRYGSVLLGVASVGAHLIGGEAVAAAWIDNFHEGKGGSSNIKMPMSKQEFLEEYVCPFELWVFLSS